MKKIGRYILLVISFFFLFNCNVSAKEKVKLYFFHGDGCPHCAEEEKLLKDISKDYPNVKIIELEVWNNKNNALLMKKVGNLMDADITGVPLTVIGSTAIAGYNDSIGQKINRALLFYTENNSNYIDLVSNIKNGTYTKGSKKIKDEFSIEDKKSDSSSTIKVPIIGNVNMKNVSIPIAAATIGLIDGFNPCAMWILLFLISMLLGMKDRRRMWVLGIIFLTTSALMYMAIMLSWFNIVVSVMASVIFRRIIAVIAIVGAVINLKGFFTTKEDGCNVVDAKKRKKIFSKIKKFTSEKSLILSILGVIGLACSVNIVELACSAGLPMVFTQVLALNNVSSISAFFYTLIYILFFLIDDIIVFSIAMATTKITAISTKYNKYSHLIGGIIMFIIGILLIFKPEWLMFNFN